MWMLTVVFLLIAGANGFLLDGNNPQGGGQTGSGQYMSLSSFYDQKRQIDYRIDQVQREDDNKLNILTSQIIQKFNALEASVAKCGNGSNDGSSGGAANGDFERKYKELQSDHLNLKQKYDDLESKYQDILGEVDKLRNTVNTKQSAQNTQIDSIKNETLELAKQFTSISQFKDVQGLSDYQSLKQNVNRLDGQAGMLLQKDQVRGQDFLALYNQTLATRSTIDALNVQLTNDLNALSQQTTTIANHADAVEKNLDVYKTVMNTTIAFLEDGLEKATERVAMTAFLPETREYHTDTVFKFSNVEYSYGINNIELFKNNGSFVCEKDGLYYISLSMTSDTAGAIFTVYVNGKSVSTTYIGIYNSKLKHTAAGSLALVLNVGDELHVKLENHLYPMSTMYGDLFSRIVIVKIK